MNAPLTRLETFLARIREIGYLGDGQPNYRLYDDMKANLHREFPGLNPDEYTRAVQVIARAAGV